MTTPKENLREKKARREYEAPKIRDLFEINVSGQGPLGEPGGSLPTVTCVNGGGNLPCNPGGT